MKIKMEYYLIPTGILLSISLTFMGYKLITKKSQDNIIYTQQDLQFISQQLKDNQFKDDVYPHLIPLIIHRFIKEGHFFDLLNDRDRRVIIKYISSYENKGLKTCVPVEVDEIIGDCKLPSEYLHSPDTHLLSNLLAIYFRTKDTVIGDLLEDWSFEKNNFSSFGDYARKNGDTLSKIVYPSGQRVMYD